MMVNLLTCPNEHIHLVTLYYTRLQQREHFHHENRVAFKGYYIHYRTIRSFTLSPIHQGEINGPFY